MTKRNSDEVNAPSRYPVANMAIIALAFWAAFWWPWRL